jgi:hypothetical protein
MRQIVPGDLVKSRYNKDIDLDNKQRTAMVSTLSAHEVCVVIDFDPEFPASIELLTTNGRGWTYDANVELARVAK